VALRIVDLAAQGQRDEAMLKRGAINAVREAR